ncbi:MAG TPA: hypothetical protein VK988_06370, partial [Acidimicrobiales bacterium]|nr:hypothetical protein [Acidimicrobiales bacterium]
VCRRLAIVMILPSPTIVGNGLSSRVDRSQGVRPTAQIRTRGTGPLTAQTSESSPRTSRRRSPRDRLDRDRSLYDWYLSLRDWLETLTHVDLDHEHAVRNVWGRSDVENALWVATPRIPSERGYALVNPPLTIYMQSAPHVRGESANGQHGCLDGKPTSVPSASQ